MALLNASPPDKHVLRHLPALDGLRGLAILLVLICHGNLLSPGPYRDGLFGRSFTLIAGAGWVGVDLFFVLSGFLITRILLQSRNSPHYFRNFYARRFLRISPLYYVYALGCFLIVPFFYTHPYNWGDFASILFCYYNFWAVRVGHVYLLSHFWSLSVEEHFYLVWPSIILACNVRALRRIAVFGMIASPILRIVLVLFFPHAFHMPSIAAVYLLTPCRLDSLCAGAWLALQEYDGTAWNTICKYAPLVFGASLLLLFAIAYRTGHFFDWLVTRSGTEHTSALVVTLGISLLAMLFGSLLVLCLSQKTVSNAFQTPGLRIIGKYSYGMYVFHGWVLVGLNAVFHPFYPHLSLLPCKILFVAIGTALTFCIAFLSYHFLEKPFLNLKRHFPNKPSH